MRLGIFRPDHSGIHEFLHDRVVDRDLHERAVLEQVDPRVPDVEYRPEWFAILERQCRPGDRRPDAQFLLVGGETDVEGRGSESVLDRVCFGEIGRDRFGESMNHRGTCHIARGMSAHPVGHREDR